MIIYTNMGHIVINFYFFFTIAMRINFERKLKIYCDRNNIKIQ